MAKSKDFDREDMDKKGSFVMYVRLPYPLAVRLDDQVKRMACTKNMFARMAIVKLIEEEEARQRANERRE